MTFAARGKDLNFVGALGPLGLFVKDGLVAPDGDGDASTNDFVTFTIDLVDPSPGDDKIDIPGELAATTAEVALAGALNATLPIFFPTESKFLGNIQFDIPDLKNFLLDPSDPDHFNFDLPSIDDFLANLEFNLMDNLRLLIDGLDFLLGGVQDTFSGSSSGVQLPVIGNALGDASGFINDFRDDVLGALRDAIDSAVNKSPELITAALFAVVGPGGLDILLDGDDPGTDVDINDITATSSLTQDVNTDFVQWEMQLGEMIPLPIPFDLGLPALGLKSADDLSLELIWSLDLGFGVNFQDGFFFLFNTDVNDPELEVSAEVTLPPVIVGSLAFLRMEIIDNNPGPSLDVDFAVNFFETAPDDAADGERLTLTELADLDAEIKLTGGANLDLSLTAGIGVGSFDADTGSEISMLPSIVTNFKLEWSFDLINPSGMDDTGLTVLQFENVGLDLGSFFSEFLGPIVRNVQTFTKPIQPIVDVLTAPIPVISDLAGEPFTLVDVAALFGEFNPELILDIAEIITFINTLPTVGDVILPLADVIDLLAVSSSTSMGLPGLFDEDGFADLRDTEQDLGGFGGIGAKINGLLGDFEGALDAVTGADPLESGDKELLKKLASKDDSESVDFIDFPIFNDPLNSALGLLFGRRVTFITVDPGPLELSFSYSQFFPIIGPLGASITGTIGVTIDFGFGFDSFGMQKFAEGGFKHPLDIFRGFFISDRENADGTGADVNEIELTGGLSGAAELNLGVAKGSVGGGVFITVGFDLDDPDNDGAVRIEELIGNLKLSDFNPLGIFDINLLIEAKLLWAIEILFVFEASGQIGPSLPLLDTTFSIPKAPLTATKVDGSTLRLNMGPFAGDRLHKDTIDGSEVFTVTQTGNGEVEVSGQGGTQTYKGVSKIEAMAGQGNDSITFVTNAGAFTPITVVVDAGFGDDLIDLTDWKGSATVHGDSGNDTILGSQADDQLFGDKGIDFVTGGGGADLVDGGEDGDFLSGDSGTPGNDTIIGGPGDDMIGGGAESDFIDGGLGNDTIRGDSSVDEVMPGVFDFVDPVGTEGADTISAGEGRDFVNGEGGDDFIGGGPGSDTLEGGDGADSIWGDSTLNLAAEPTAALPSAEGHDRIFGEAESPTGVDGADTIFGEGGNDFIRGNADNDLIEGNFGGDTIFGDTGNDTLFGQSDGDIMFGGPDDDEMFGGTGNDVMFGDDGLVARLGANGASTADDEVVGDGNPNLTLGFTGDGDPLSRDLYITEVNGVTDGNDTMTGDSGEDTLFGGSKNDELNGDFDPSAALPDEVPAEDDVLIGDGGRVELTDRRLKQIETIPGADATEVGNDTIQGQGGSDFIFGGGADDELYGRMSSPVPAENEEDPEIRDDDVILGDDGKMVFENIPGDPREVTVIKEILTNMSAAEGGDDEAFGNKHNDIIFGGIANDTLEGNTGTDVVIGDNGQILFEGGIIHFIQTTDTAVGTGGTDSVFGNEANDTLIGGVAGDTIKGNLGDDIALGDNGLLDYLFDGDTDITTLDLVRTKDFQMGGATDSITGNQGSDTLMGGDAGDQIFGDTDLDPNVILGAGAGTEVIIGDQGQVLYAKATVDDQELNLITLIETTDVVEADGGADTVFGNDFNDTILGGVAGDILHGESQMPVPDTLLGNTGNDVIIGDEGRLRYDIDSDPVSLDLIQTFATGVLGDDDSIFGNDGADTAMGGSADDLIHGDFYTDDQGANFARANGPDSDVLIGDGGEVTYDQTAVTRIRTIEPSQGGMDTIGGNDFADTILGGFNDDLLLGEAETSDLSLAAGRHGDDIVMGDNGELNFVLLSDTILGRPDVEEHLGGTTLILDGATADPSTLDVITTTDPTLGGNDTIRGNAGSDTLFGGTLEDRIWGDTDDADLGIGADGPDGFDIVAGDHMKLYPSLVKPAVSYFDPFFINNNFFAIDTAEADGADNDGMAGNDFDDTMFGNAADDTMLGQQGDDVMFGGTGDDDLVGGQNIQSFSPTAKDDLDPLSPADVAAINAATLADQNPLDNRTNDLNDVIDGGAGFDLIAGDNAAIIHGAGPFNGAYSTNQRFRNVEADGLAYHMVTVDLQNGLASVDVGFEANVTADNNADPGGFPERVVILWDHSRAAELEAAGAPATPRPFGNDVIAGGSEDDVIFAQLGDDIVQGDGAIELVADPDNTPESFLIPDTDLFGAMLYYNVTEQTTDGNDYVEGNGGNDILLGNLGQDDILGGSSDLFGLLNGVFGQDHPETRVARPDGADQIFGGAGNPVRLARNDYVGSTDTDSTGPTDDDPLIPIDERHDRDADFILGDNGRVFRIVENSAYVSYEYDPLSRLIARTATPIDYRYTVDDVLPEAIPSFEGIGAGDLVMGESGDDTIHGLTGDDALFGNSDDDDVYGEIGHDWVSGGTGQDGILGDDGLLLTSRNTEKANKQDDTLSEPLYGVARLDEVDQVIETPGNIHLALIHVDGALKKTADLITFDLRPDVTALAANDILFGGLDDDFIHAGAGSDAISGAEALPEFYAGGTVVNQFMQTAQQIAPIQASEVDPPAPPALTPEPFWFDVAPYNPGDTLRFEGNGKPAEFFLYNEFEPRRKILLSDQGEVIEFSTGGVFSLVTTLEAVFGASLIIPAPVDLQVVVQTGQPRDAVVHDVTVGAAGPFGDTAALLVHIQAAMDLDVGPGVVEATIDAEGDLTLLLVGAHGQQQVFLNKVVAPADVHDFLLNFDETEGIVDERFVDAIEGPGAKNSDGDDVIFGDLGNDWIVGGTGRDHSYGGRDEDLINADDDHDTTFATAGDPGLKHNDPPVDALDNNIPDPFQAYADYAYGGAGRDVLILNTGADRMIDWVGEFNSYIAPFAPFGAFHISRNLMPHLREFLYDLSEADGADQSVPDAARFVAHKAADVRIDDPDPARNGEPYGEMGLILQQDEGWTDQTGGPVDPQAGNIPGGPREIMRRELFSGGGAPLAFVATAGTWTVESGQLTADPLAVGAEAVTLYHLNEWQPSYFEILVTANAEKDKAGVNSNAFAIFDYQDELNFKFAGFDAGLDKLRIGHRTADGWIVEVQSNLRMKADTDYDIFVSINGTTVTLLVGAGQLSHDFGSPLNSGYIGLATDNSVTHFDDWQVQKLPPDWAASIEDDFSDGVADLFLVRAGNWQVDAGRYVGTAGATDDALATSPIVVDQLARVEFHVTASGDDLSGIVFDYYGTEDFKFAAISAASNEVLIGHRTNRGWFVDNAVARPINAGEDFRLTVSLAGSTVSVLVDGEAVVGYVFNSILNDGQMGLIARGGSSSFDDVLIRSNDADMAVAPTGGEALLLDAPAAIGAPTGSGLSHSTVRPVLNQAVSLWTGAGIDPQSLQWLTQVDVRIVNLPGSLLGYQTGTSTIWLDQDAAGFGWWDGISGFTSSGVDLLSVVSHELGHVLRFDHDVLPPSLGIGDRELPLVPSELVTSASESLSGATSTPSLWFGTFGGRSLSSLFDDLTHDAIPLIPATIDFHRITRSSMMRSGRARKFDDEYWSGDDSLSNEGSNMAAIASLFADFDEALADELIGFAMPVGSAS